MKPCKVFSATKFLLVPVILIALMPAVTPTAQAQNCIPGKGVLHYIVRDEKGKIIDASGFFSEGFRVEEFDLPKDKTGNTVEKIKVVSRGSYNANGCGLPGDVEMTLTHKGKTMTLAFKNVRGYRRIVFDSIPFKAGKYEIDARAAEREETGVVSAKAWKKVG